MSRHVGRSGLLQPQDRAKGGTRVEAANSRSNLGSRSLPRSAHAATLASRAPFWSRLGSGSAWMWTPIQSSCSQGSG
jgi:hypothetical protein